MRPRQVGEDADRAGGERLDVLQAVGLLGGGREERRGAGQRVPVPVARRRQGPDPHPLPRRHAHRQLGHQVRLVQARLDADRRALAHALDHLEEQPWLLALRDVDGRVQHQRHRRLVARPDVLQTEAEVDPRQPGLLGEGLDRPPGDHLARLVRRALGVGERGEERAGQRQRGLLHRVRVRRGRPPQEVHQPWLGTRGAERAPHVHRVEHVHADHHGGDRVDELERDQVETGAPARSRPDQLRAGEPPQQPPHQRGAGVVPDDVAAAVDERRVVLDGDLGDHRASPPTVSVAPAWASAASSGLPAGVTSC